MPCTTEVQFPLPLEGAMEGITTANRQITTQVTNEPWPQIQSDRFLPEPMNPKYTKSKYKDLCSSILDLQNKTSSTFCKELMKGFYENKGALSSFSYKFKKIDIICCCLQKKPHRNLNAKDGIWKKKYEKELSRLNSPYYSYRKYSKILECERGKIAWQVLFLLSMHKLSFVVG